MITTTYQIPLAQGKKQNDSCNGILNKFFGDEMIQAQHDFPEDFLDDTWGVTATFGSPLLIGAGSSYDSQGGISYFVGIMRPGPGLTMDYYGNQELGDGNSVFVVLSANAVAGGSVSGGGERSYSGNVGTPGASFVIGVRFGRNVREGERRKFWDRQRHSAQAEIRSSAMTSQEKRDCLSQASVLSGERFMGR